MMLAFLIDAPQTLSADDGVSSWVQVAKTGTFKDPRYGTFKITQAEFDRWMSNFKELVLDAGRLGLPADVDHSPEKKGETEAAGWIKQLEQRSDELWARVEWNTLGQELIREKRYAYISPSYNPDYRDEKGVSHGNTLLGIALTNRPFLQMATVNLSEFTFADAQKTPPEPESYSHRQMELTTVLSSLGVTLADLGVDENADEATVLSALATHQAEKAKAAAPAPDQVILSAAQVKSLTEQAAAGQAAAETLRVQTFDTAFDAAQAAGKVVLAQRDTFRSMYDAQPDTTLTLLDGLQPVVNMTPVGVGGTPLDLEPAAATLAAAYTDSVTPMQVDADGLRTLAAAEAIQVARNIPFEQALALAESGVTA